MSSAQQSYTAWKHTPFEPGFTLWVVWGSSLFSMVSPRTPLSCTVGPMARRHAGVSGWIEIRSGCSMRTVRGESTAVTTTGHAQVDPATEVELHGYSSEPATSPAISLSIRWSDSGVSVTSNNSISPRRSAAESFTHSTVDPRDAGATTARVSPAIQPSP